jgi:hypothetical protein
MNSGDAVIVWVVVLIATAILSYHLGHAHGRLNEINRADDVVVDEEVKQPYIPGQQ